MTITADVAGVSVADTIRVLAVMMTVFVMFGMTQPIVVRAEPDAKRVWLLMLCLWTYMARGALSAIANLGSPHMPWYATPVTFLGGLIGCIYLLVYYRDVRRGQRLAAKVNAIRAREAADA